VKTREKSINPNNLAMDFTNLILYKSLKLILLWKELLQNHLQD